MKRQSALHDLLTAASAILRVPAAYLALPGRGTCDLAVTHGPMPDTIPPDEIPVEPPTGHDFVQQTVSSLSVLASAPWCYRFQLSLRIPRTGIPQTGATEGGILCFLSGEPIEADHTPCREGLAAIVRQITQVIDCPVEDCAQRSSVSFPVPSGWLPPSHIPTTLPSIEDLPGIGTFEIRFGSQFITLSSELIRLSGLPTDMQCPIALFAQCMPVPDMDLIHFADGASESLMLAEIDYAVLNMSDQTQSWVRRRAEIETDESGKPWRLIGTLEDITRDRVATNRLSAMVMLGDALRRVDTPDQAYHAAASALGDALGADRAGWALCDGADEAHFEVMPDWRGASIPSAAGIYARRNYAAAFGVLGKDLLLVVRDAHENIWLPCVMAQHGEQDQIRAQLLMPLMGQGRVTHCLFVQSCTPRDWSDQELAFVRAVSDRAQAAAASLEARAHQQTLHQELAHRLKNTLALVQALANQSLRGVENRAAVKAFEKRLVALGSAHELLMRQSWQHGDLAMLAREVLSRIAPIERFQLTGEPVSIGPNTATTLGLMLHELGTNAAKYGALSVDNGTITLDWHIEENEGREILALHWLERGGPPASEPRSSGFGSRLLKTGFGHQGHATLRYPVTGCDASFTIPLRQAQDN